jgi:peroxiredoxin
MNKEFQMRRSTLFAATATLVFGAALVQASVSVGQAAPDFNVKDTSGKAQSLAAYKGKYVVLEWVNPGCPFVQKHYDSNNMQATQKAATAKGVVWLTVSSTSPDAGDYKKPAELAAWSQSKHAAPTATLMDDAGTIGKAFGARTTPHVFVIDPAGKLVYAGAIDDKPSARKTDVAGAKNYVTAALDEALAGKPISKATSEPYGCSVKY